MPGRDQEPSSPYRETLSDHLARLGCGLLVGLIVAGGLFAYDAASDLRLLGLVVGGVGFVAVVAGKWFWENALNLIRWFT